METQPYTENDAEFRAQLQDCASQLVEKLQAEELDQASALIHNLMEARDKHIFNSVGQLTRGLHNAIINFHVDADLDNDPPDEGKSEIRDASDRLNYVIELTQKAANQTMDKVEAVAPMALNLGQEAQRLRTEWHKLKRREMSKDEFKILYDQMGDFLDQMESGTSQLNSSLQDIILEQGYQDLSGQVLTKVIGLITDVENELVHLMRIAGQVEEVTGMASEEQEIEETDSPQAEGPQIHADKKADVVSGQDEVDDLLSSLGF